MNIVHKGEFNITGRGKVFLINLADNKLPLLRKEFYQMLMDSSITVDGRSYIVRGIEAWGWGSDVEHSEIGILVRHINDDKLPKAD